jgi:hypothetical protein
MTLLLLLRNSPQDTSDNQPAYLVGSQDTSDSIPAYTAGQASTSDNSPAYTKGQSTSSDSTSAYLKGSIDVSDDIPSYLQGSINVSSTTAAFLAGEQDVSDSTPAFAQGNASTSGTISAWLNGYGERLHPDGDISQSDNWQREDSSTSNLYVSIDEFPEDDDDYVWYDDAPEGKYFEVSLANPTGETVPEGDVHIVWRGYRKAGTQAITVKVELRQSTTVIASQSKLLTDTPMTFKYTLSSGEKSSITDWTNLRLRFIVEDVT